MKALVIRRGATSIEPLELSEDDTAHYEKIKSTIGNWITSCFNIRTQHGRIFGYCDDEFLLRPIKAEDWSCALGETLRTDAPYPIGNPVVIAGTNEAGENRTLTDEEISHFTLGSEVYFHPKEKGVPVLKLRLLEWEG